MTDRKDIQSSLQEWLENPYWAEYYTGAPSDRCREFIALEFYCSDFEDEASAAGMDRIEAEMNIPELRWLLKYCGNHPRRKILQDRITALAVLDRKRDSSHT